MIVMCEPIEPTQPQQQPRTLRCDECGRLTAQVYPAVVDGVECLTCRACRDASVRLLELAYEQASARRQARREGIAG